MVQGTIRNLDEKPYRLWGGDQDVTTGLVCLFVPRCQFCDTDMEFWNAVPQNFAINDGTDEKNSHAMDIVLWCPTCGYMELFGVAVSKEHYDEVQKRLKFLPHKKIPVPKKEIFQYR